MNYHTPSDIVTKLLNALVISRQLGFDKTSRRGCQIALAVLRRHIRAGGETLDTIQDKEYHAALNDKYLPIS